MNTDTHKLHKPTAGDIYRFVHSGVLVELAWPVELDFYSKNGKDRSRQVRIEEANADERTTWIAFADVDKFVKNRRELRPYDATRCAFVISAVEHAALRAAGRALVKG